MRVASLRGEKLAPETDLTEVDWAEFARFQPSFKAQIDALQLRRAELLSELAGKVTPERLVLSQLSEREKSEAQKPRYPQEHIQIRFGVNEMLVYRFDESFDARLASVASEIHDTYSLFIDATQRSVGR